MALCKLADLGVRYLKNLWTTIVPPASNLKQRERAPPHAWRARFGRRRRTGVVYHGWECPVREEPAIEDEKRPRMSGPRPLGFAPF